MKNKLLLVTVSLAFLFASVDTASCQAVAKYKAKRDMEAYRYEIECVGVGTAGTSLIKVWSYSKKPKVAIEQCKKNAIHGVIFKGFAGSGVGCISQKALVNDPRVEEQKMEFFDNFFDDRGQFNNYISLTNDGSIDAGDILKVGKEYKIGVVVSVNKDALQKYLKTAGIIN